jgi:FkbM family methyltransferase
VIRRPKFLAKMFLDRRRTRGARDFAFRPGLRRQDGLDVIDMVARDGGFRASVRLRPGTSDLDSFEQIFLGGEYGLRWWWLRRHDVETIYRATERPLILDLGANVGLASLYFRKAWPRARIVAVEPDTGNVALARRNAPNAVILHAAIASERGRVAIVNPEAAAWAYRTAPADDGAIDAITVADILERHSDCSPFLCKIDIEGAEKELFSKNTAWLGRFPVVVIELHDWLLPREATSRNFLRAVADLDRDVVWIGQNVWSMANAQCD